MGVRDCYACRNANGSLKIVPPGKTRQELYCRYCQFTWRGPGCLFEPQWQRQGLDEKPRRRRRRKREALPCPECRWCRVGPVKNGRGRRATCERGIFADLPYSWLGSNQSHLPVEIRTLIQACEGGKEHEEQHEDRIAVV